jgi:glutathione S-transferase
MALKVLGRITSINVRKVVWALEEMGVSYEREDWGMPIRDPKVQEFLALTPNAQVPVLIDDGFVLWESNAIVRYLADKHGKLVPADPQGRALVDQWLYWQLGELNPTWGYAVYALLRKNPAYTETARIADSVAKWTAKMEILDGQLMKAPFVIGDRFTIADVAIGLSSHRWYSTPIPGRMVLPAVEDHYNRMKVRGPKWMGKATP